MKKFSIFTMFILAFCLIFTGCGAGIEPVSMPTMLQQGSMGGHVIKLGASPEQGDFGNGEYEYLYFANAYQPSAISKASENQNVTTKGIKRVKTDANGNIAEDAVIEDIAGKITGYDKGEMFVVGNYLYYTTINTHQNQQNNEYEFDLVTIARVKLDATENSEVVDKIQDKDISLYVTGGSQTRVLLYEKTNKVFKVMNISAGETSFTQIEEDVTSMVFPKEYGEDLSVVYYTKEDDQVVIGGNMLYSYTFEKEGEKTDFVKGVNGETITLNSLSNGCLFFSVAGANQIAGNTSLNTIMDGQIITHVTYDSSSVTDISDIQLMIKMDGTKVILFKKSSYIFAMNYSQTNKTLGDAVEIVDADTATTVEYFDKNYIILSSSDAVYKLTLNSIEDASLNTLTKIISQSDYKGLDYDGKFVYFYAKLNISGDNKGTENYYLHRVSAYEQNGEAELISKIEETDQKILAEESI